jgi:hypothetical protein
MPTALRLSRGKNIAPDLDGCASRIDLSHHDINSSIFPRKTGLFQLRCTFDAPFEVDSELEVEFAVYLA